MTHTRITRILRQSVEGAYNAQTICHPERQNRDAPGFLERLKQLEASGAGESRLDAIDEIIYRLYLLRAEIASGQQLANPDRSDSEREFLRSYERSLEQIAKNLVSIKIELVAESQAWRCWIKQLRDDE